MKYNIRIIFGPKEDVYIMKEILTFEQIQTIFCDHGFPDDNPTLTNVGFRNQVYIGDHAVLKVYPEDNRRGYQKEFWFYKTAKLDCIPRLYAAGENWILMERIHGVGLFRLWRDLSDQDRRAMVSKIADIALAVSDTDITGTEAFLTSHENYGEALVRSAEELSERLQRCSGIPDDLLQRVMAYIHRYAYLLDDKQQYLVYNDLHFDNLMVTEEGRVVLLDFEMLAIGPKDLVLDVWQRMLIHPFTYANEDDHEHTHPKDYVHLLDWMQEFAPSLFCNPYVRRRVNLYGMIYEMDLLCDYPMGAWPRERLERYLSETLW